MMFIKPEFEVIELVDDIITLSVFSSGDEGGEEFGGDFDIFKQA